MNLDQKSQTEIEAAVFRRLVAHLQGRSDAQNIDLMNLAGFCRNCLSNWFEAEAKALGLEVPRDQAREMVYGMPYADWKALNQRAAQPAAEAAFDAVHKH